MVEKELGNLPTLYDRIKKALPIFGEKKSTENSKRKIRASVRVNAHQMLIQLNRLKESIKYELEEVDNSYLLESFEAVINPLLREFEKIDRKKEGRQDSDSAIESYSVWMEKAKLWVSLFSKPNDRKGIIKAVVANEIEMAAVLIDRDLKTLQDYYAHVLISSKIPESNFLKVAEKIDLTLVAHVESLLSLKHNNPSDYELENLARWKAQINEKRSQHFNAALHAIDAIINSNSITLESSKGEENSELQEIRNQIAFLESEIQVLFIRIESGNYKESVSVQILQSELAFFEEELNKLMQDLRLTTELYDHINVLSEKFENLKKNCLQI